jgi:hypothetical protein
MKRLTLNLPDGLLETVMALSGSAEKTETIVTALRAYETALRRERLLALRGHDELLSSPEREAKP